MYIEYVAYAYYYNQQKTKQIVYPIATDIIAHGHVNFHSHQSSGDVDKLIKLLWYANPAAQRKRQIFANEAKPHLTELSH